MIATLTRRLKQYLAPNDTWLFGVIFLVGGVASAISMAFDQSENQLTAWDSRMGWIVTLLYAATGLLILVRPQWTTGAVLLSVLPTEVYEQGVMYLAVHHADPISYYAAAGSGPFFPLIYLVMFVMLPRGAVLWSSLNCAGFLIQYLLNITLLSDPAPSPLRTAAEHVLLQVVVAHPIYVLSLSYIVRLRERLHAARQEAFTQKEDFLAMMSHEIRNLLQTMVGTIDLLDMRLQQPPERRAIARLHSSAAQLQTYLNDIGELTKLEDPTLRIEATKVDLVALLEDVVDEWRPKARDKGIEVELSRGPSSSSVETDASRVRQIVSNLVSNAIKYTMEGHVVIVVRTTEGGQVAVEVADTGIGIEAPMLEKIFLPHVRLHNAIECHTEGSGLGLAIVQRLARSIGGSVEVESRPGEGSRFVLSIPEQFPTVEPSTRY